MPRTADGKPDTSPEAIGIAVAPKEVSFVINGCTIIKTLAGEYILTDPQKAEKSFAKQAAVINFAHDWEPAKAKPKPPKGET